MTIDQIFYQLKNWRAKFRGLLYKGRMFVKTAGGGVPYDGELRATIIHCVCGDPGSHFKKVCPQGKISYLGKLSSLVVTTAGVNYMRDDFNAASGGADITNFNYHDSGTGTNAEAIGDTALQTPAGPARVAGTQSAPASKQYRTVGTISYTATLAITEHGIFSASTSGTLWDRSVFSAINMVNGDSIQFTYTLTINDGG